MLDKVFLLALLRCLLRFITIYSMYLGAWLLICKAFRRPRRPSG